MGRGSMQGSPWHYEYGDGKRKSNSKHCAYNVGYCSNKYSQYHNKECEGQLYCEDFERSSFVSTDSDQTNAGKKVQGQKANGTNKTKNTKKTPSAKVKSDRQDSSKPIKTYEEYPVPQSSVKLGDKITVMNVQTRYTVSMLITNSQSPYLGKKMDQIVVLKSGQYKIVKIIRRKGR